MTVAEPCAGGVVIVIVLTMPAIGGRIVLLALFAITAVVMGVITGAGKLTVIANAVGDEVPPGPVAVMLILSLPA